MKCAGPLSTMRNSAPLAPFRTVSRSSGHSPGRPETERRRKGLLVVLSSANVEFPGEEAFYVANPEQARIAGKAVLERGQGKAGPCHPLKVASGQPAVEHARRKGIAAADPVDNAGDRHFLGLRFPFPAIDPRR